MQFLVAPITKSAINEIFRGLCGSIDSVEGVEKKIFSCNFFDFFYQNTIKRQKLVSMRSDYFVALY